MIYIVNKYKDKRPGIPSVYCGRGSALGNPFVIGKDGNRDEVCDKYEDWFYTEAQPFLSPVDPVYLQLQQIKRMASTGDVQLECFCAPKRCHCETIKKYIEGELNG